MNFSSKISIITLVCAVLLVACEPQASKVPPSVELEPIKLYQGKNLQPWQLAIKSHQEEQLVSGDFTQLPDGLVSLKTVDKDAQQDAILFNFKDSWSSGVYLKNGSVDLSQYVAQGTVEFELRVDDIQQGKIDLMVNCQWNCKHSYRLREWAQEHEGQGWQHLAIPLHCLVDNNANLTQVSQPFNLSTGGKGQVAVANVLIKAHGKPNMPCHSAIELATSPDVLNEYWSVDWWMPRHEQKVAQANLGEAQLVMIGDSITHGWENDGKAVWDEHFGDINTLNLGYGGDRTENVLWRLQHGELGKTEPKLVVMMIGTNNTGHRMDSPEAIAAGVDKILHELKQQVPEAKVLLLAIFPRDAKPDSLARINNFQATALIQQLALDQGLLFADFNADFLSDDGTLTEEMMPDLLHPKAKGYEIWAQQLTPFIEQYIRQSAQ